MKRGIVAGLVGVLAVTLAVAGGVLTSKSPTQERPNGSDAARHVQLASGPETVVWPAAPDIQARAAILIDLATDRVLFGKHVAEHRPVASLVKIMTAMLVLERSKLSAVVRVGKTATKTEPINLGLRPGERISVRNLMYGLLLWSGNDAAVALAQHVSGTIRAFVAAMNGKAAALGLANTHFSSPNGLNDEGYSSAADIAAMARDALADPTFASFADTRWHWVPGPKQQVHRLHNLNSMLFTYLGATGVKTGYTHAAGTCVVTSATRGEHSLLAVVLGEPTTDSWKAAYRDSANLLDYGFAVERGSSER